MTDNRDDAEYLDGDALGEEVGDDGLPGTANFPPDRPWAVDDPTRDISDDVVTRERRLDHQKPHPTKSFVLVAEGSEGFNDDEGQEFASAVDAGEGDLSAEEIAVHVVE
jgi:hypothetical protein